jgi:hypothetical protein
MVCQRPRTARSRDSRGGFGGGPTAQQIDRDSDALRRDRATTPWRTKLRCISSNCCQAVVTAAARSGCRFRRRGVGPLLDREIGQQHAVPFEDQRIRSMETLRHGVRASKSLSKAVLLTLLQRRLSIAARDAARHHALGIWRRRRFRCGRSTIWRAARKAKVAPARAPWVVPSVGEQGLRTQPACQGNPAPHP